MCTIVGVQNLFSVYLYIKNTLLNQSILNERTIGLCCTLSLFLHNGFSCGCTNFVGWTVHSMDESFEFCGNILFCPMIYFTQVFNTYHLNCLVCFFGKCVSLNRFSMSEKRKFSRQCLQMGKLIFQKTNYTTSSQLNFKQDFILMALHALSINCHQ